MENSLQDTHGIIQIHSHDLRCYVLEAPNSFFHLLTNTFSSRDLFPPPFHHMTLPPDRLPIILKHVILFGYARDSY